MSRKQIAALLVIAGGSGFGAMGGEYSTLDWWTLRRQVDDENAAVARLRIEVDSLGQVAKALETDSATEERVARESFGMLRKGEILYRIEPAKP